jgi:murein DD-endopeptidase MepM/ murein hydrolase activator NlpD
MAPFNILLYKMKQFLTYTTIIFIGILFIFSCTSKNNYLVKYHNMYGEKFVYSSIYPFNKSSTTKKETASYFNKKNYNFMWPVHGILFSHYGLRHGKMHHGIDIGVPEGTPVKAASSGKVIYSDNKVSGYGNLVIIKHDDNPYSTIYAHNKKNLVQEGHFVKKGEIIAYVGRTGRTTGVHLHFELREGRKSINPLTYLK